MNFIPLPLQGAVMIEGAASRDNRGRFSKLFEKEIYAQAGIPFHLNETFVSWSARNVIRGLHFQTRRPQAKLVSVLEGRVYDVIVDLRPESPTFKQHFGVELSTENCRILYVPRGFAHGFAALSDNAIMLYQCDGAYDQETDTGIRFDDADLAIKWPVSPQEAILSQRDRGLLSLQQYVCQLGG